MKVLVTGAAGFIGFYTCKKLIDEGHKVVGLDNINDYYSVELKYDRLKQLGIGRESIANGKLVESEDDFDFSFYKCDLKDKAKIDALFEQHSFNAVINLAAQAGVRYSLKNPYAYIDSNITGFLNILEAARHNPVDHLIYASSSSVYGANTSMPFSTSDNIDHPMSLYAATKKSN
jgi:UDP-glucuronate 4-epimerase